VPDASETSGVPGDAAELRAENARLRESAERLRMLVEDKDAKIAELEERIARLERLISRNSGNSSMSPSTDDLPGKKPPERRTRQGGMKRKPGKQPGAPGAFLAWNEHPDKTVDVFPEGICPCGGIVDGVMGAVARQVVHHRDDGEGGGADRQVDVEDPPPAQMLGDEAPR